jgi:hypothetical protein
MSFKREGSYVIADIAAVVAAECRRAPKRLPSVPAQVMDLAARRPLAERYSCPRLRWVGRPPAVPMIPLAEGDLYAWIALRRVSGGGVAKLGDRYLDRGHPTPGLVADALEKLLAGERWRAAPTRATCICWHPRGPTRRRGGSRPGSVRSAGICGGSHHHARSVVGAVPNPHCRYPCRDGRPRSENHRPPHRWPAVG